MKKIILILLFLPSWVMGDTYLNALRNRHNNLSEREADYLIKHPGTLDTIRGMFGSAKLASDELLLYPNPKKIYMVYYRDVVWYKEGWHKITVPVKARLTDEGYIFFLIYLAIIALILLPPLFSWIAYIRYKGEKSRKAYVDVTPYTHIVSPLFDNGGQIKDINFYIFIGWFCVLFLMHPIFPHESNMAKAILIWPTILIASNLLLRWLSKTVMGAIYQDHITNDINNSKTCFSH